MRNKSNLFSQDGNSNVAQKGPTLKDTMCMCTINYKLKDMVFDYQQKFEMVNHHYHKITNENS